MRHLLFIVILGCLFQAQAQTTEFYAGTDANSFYIKSGESLSVAGLTLTPSADFNLTNNQIIKATTVANNADQSYMPIVFRFANTTAAFSGTLSINYTGVSTTGFVEANLRLQHHNGTTWALDAGSSVNTGTDIVSSGTFSSSPLKELAISDAITALPINLMKFTAEKAGRTTLLKWSTSQEQNTASFEIQRSEDNIQWKTIGSLPAAGFSQTASAYRFVDNTPLLNNRINYYRIAQIENDAHRYYSHVIPVIFPAASENISIQPNPARQNLQVISPEAQILQLISTTGRVVLQTNLNAGGNTLSVNHLPRGMYVVKTGNTTTKLILN
jgi:Secretion system C-terminal sorting domain